MANEITPNSNIPGSGDFRLDDRQGLIYERLNRLVSLGAGAFYKDACRHIFITPPFVSSTHIVGHLLREVESALRDVLESLTGPITTKNKQNGHEVEVKTILKALEIEETDPVAQAWLQFTGDDALHSRAHRRNLDPVRPLDEEFLEFWYQMQTILDVILDKFESKYTKVFSSIDELAVKSDPTKADAEIIHSHIPNNFIAHQRFFSNLQNPKWLALLKDKGVFKSPPEPEYNPDEQTTRHLPWPAATYLEKMAPVESTIVGDILNEVNEVDNSNVKAGLLRIMTSLKKEDRIKLLTRAKGWIKNDHSFFQLTLTEPAAKLIKEFIKDGEEDAAFELTSILLEILPDPKPRPAVDKGEFVYVPKRNPKTRLDDWHYNKYLKEDLQELVDMNPERTFDLICSLLQSYIETENEGRKDHNYEDNSSISRPAIEDHEQNHNHDNIEDGLITQIRDIGLKIIHKNPKKITELFTKLESRRWTIFCRIGFFLLAENPSAAPVLVAKQLTNETYFDSSDVEHEFSRLLNRGFKDLSIKDKKVILTWIDKAEKISERVEKRKTETSVSDEQEVRFRETWQRDQLSYMKDDLPDEYREKYDAYVKKYGAPEHPDLPFYSTSWVGPVSDHKAAELSEMQTEKLIELLKTWKPKEEAHGFNATKEGLGRELGAAVKLKPDFFNSIAENFKGLDPTYVRNYLQVFGEIAQHGASLDWNKLLDLTLWVVEQPRAIPGRKGEMMDQDPDWGWARKAAVSLISRGLNHNLIPCEKRELVWSVIEPITKDPDPTPEDDARREESSDDAYSAAINCTRGEAMGAVVEYALWVYRCIEKQPEGKEKVKSGLKIMPEIRQILELHLDPQKDPSVAVRAIYGRFFPWLLLIDRQWVLKNLDKIMPPGKFDNRLYAAAWNTIMLYTPAYNDPFEVLKERYYEAIENLGKVDKSKKRHTDRDERVAEHLMLFYGRGKIKLTDKIFKKFWEVASDELRGHALDFVGRHLKSEGGMDEEILERTRALWESRLSAARQANEKTRFENEMSAFGWWFASGRFDDKWSCEQYLEALEIGRKTQTDYFVAERLIELVKTLPLESVKILSKIILVDKPSWIVLGNKEEIKIILLTALRSENKYAQQKAKDLINRLVARGYTDLNDLLK